VREGFEGGLYDLDEAKFKVNGYLEAIKKSEQDVKRIQGTMSGNNSEINIEELKKQLKEIAQGNLDKATFAEKRDIINKLGIRVYPSEDLRTMKIRCSLNFGNDGNSQPSDRCAIIQFVSLRLHSCCKHKRSQ